MPFEYQPYHNPYAASIADLMLQQGQIRGQQAQQNAAIWGRAATGIGDAISGVAGAIGQQQQQEHDPRVQLARLQVKEAQSTEKSRAFFETTLKDPTNYKPDGTIDDAKVTAALRAGDIGAWQQWQAISAANAKNSIDLHLKAQEIQKNDADLAEKTRQARQAQATYLGTLAYHGRDILNQNPGDPLHARDTVLATVARAASDGALPEDQANQVILQAAQTPPDRLVQYFDRMVPPDLAAKLDKEKADTAKANAEAAKNTAEAQNLKEFGRTTPGTPEEQYLTAIAHGDQPKAALILKSIRDTASAHKDPAQQALANELANLRGDEARARLDALKKKNAPIDIEPDIQTTRSGRSYIDLSGYTAEERPKAREAANAAGAIPVSREQANALQEIDNARLNQRSILDQVGDLLPKNAAGRLASAPLTKLEQLFQTDEQKAAFASWRTAAIQTLRATAGSKGLRINQAEIAQAIENDIPKLTDTYAVAQQKVKNIETMLENAEKSILVRDRRAAPPTPQASHAPIALTPALSSLERR